MDPIPHTQDDVNITIGSYKVVNIEVEKIGKRPIISTHIDPNAPPDDQPGPRVSARIGPYSIEGDWPDYVITP